jgi:hypothetical protein
LPRLKGPEMDCGGDTLNCNKQSFTPNTLL